MTDLFNWFAVRVAALVGSPTAFIVACVFILAWLASGPYFHFNTGWNFLINSSTTVITFLLVCLLQTSQNRDATALQVKLDELLRAVEGARTDLAGLESRPQSDLEAARQAVHDTTTDTQA